MSIKHLLMLEFLLVIIFIAIYRLNLDGELVVFWKAASAISFLLMPSTLVVHKLYEIYTDYFDLKSKAKKVRVSLYSVIVTLVYIIIPVGFAWGVLLKYEYI